MRSDCVRWEQRQIARNNKNYIYTIAKSTTITSTRTIFDECQNDQQSSASSIKKHCFRLSVSQTWTTYGFPNPKMCFRNFRMDELLLYYRIVRYQQLFVSDCNQMPVCCCTVPDSYTLYFERFSFLLWILDLIFFKWCYCSKSFKFGLWSLNFSSTCNWI